MNQKALWNKLAKENARYYINSDYGKGIDEEKFRQSGEDDYLKYVRNEWAFSKQPLLEIGCGNGRMTEFMRIDYQVLGIDISGEMIRQARERVDCVYFAVSNGMIIPFDDNSIGSAFSYLVFQHMKTREMVESNFREVYRVLKPGGIFKVRVRTDKIDNMNKWWAGVACDETYPLSIGFHLIKKEPVENYGLWLWLEKP